MIRANYKRSPLSPITFQHKKIASCQKISLNNYTKPAMLSSSNYWNKNENLSRTISMDTYKNQENQFDFSNQRWIEKDQILPNIPFMYPLDSNHIIIKELQPSVIARNIRECLRVLSITVVFDKLNVSKRLICHYEKV